MFRRDAKTRESFAVLIEPIIGQEVVEPYASTRLFAPLLSGFGYTSTSKGEGYICVVPGLGGGVETREYERLTWRSLRQFDGELWKYIKSQRDTMLHDTSAIRYSSLLRTTPESLSGDYNLLAYHTPEHGRKGSTVNFAFPLHSLDDFMDAINMQSLFSMMERAETAFKKPQYFEWALTHIGGKTRYWITQIADVDPVRDLSEFVVPDNLIFTAHTVKGTGIRTCNRIAVCDNPSDVAKLADFNEKSNGYVLLYGSRLMSGALRKSFQYWQISNASVFLEKPNNRRTTHPVAHFQGIVDMTRKLFGVLDYHGEHGLDWDSFDAKVVEDGGIKVYHGNVRVIASERQDKMYVAALD